MALPWDLASGRSVDIELGGQEVITVDFDSLDANADDVVEVLKEGQPKAGYWTRLAGEYLQLGNIDAAEKICLVAVETFTANGTTASLPAVYSLLANIQLARARRAPKLKLPNARQDVLSAERSREEYMRDATQFLNNCDKILSEEGGEQSIKELLMLTRAIHQLASSSLDDAMKSFDVVLGIKPTNLIALMGKARILYAKRAYHASLKVFQQVLSLNPYCKPDPRIGIGLCLWALNYKEKAKAAWQRSLEINPEEWPAQLLLGVDALNTSKDVSLSEQERSTALVTGSKLVETAFKSNRFNAASANALCDLFLRKGQHRRALKLAERTIQFADTLTLLTDGYVRAGRVCHADGSYDIATSHYQSAAEGQPKNIFAAIGLAQMQVYNDEIPAAVHTLDSLLQAPNAPRSLEATAMLASLRMHPRRGVSDAELSQERARARELLDGVLRAIEQYQEEQQKAVPGRGLTAHPPSRAVLEDIEMYVEVARLWRTDNLQKTERALQEALRISEAAGNVDPRLTNDLAVLTHLEQHPELARPMYESALTTATSLGSEAGEWISTSILYNLARAYEDVGEEIMATEAYDKLLSRHPEYVDAKIRKAYMHMKNNQNDKAHELIKTALSSQDANLELRAFYTYFLFQTGAYKVASPFVHATLKDHDRHDLYALCAAAWLQYHNARENKDGSQKALEERKGMFERAVQFYTKALVLDPSCAVAAQGLAISSAEDALGTFFGALPPGPSPDDAQRRADGAREALEVFAKVREALSDGSVYVNMGHCYFVRDQLDRAIESYETASKRYYNGSNVSVLMHLCRTWYAKATKEQSFASMNTALSYVEQALDLQPQDKATLYNTAMIQQKAVEMMFSLKENKRTLVDLERAIEQGRHAQKLFATLAEDPADALPYSKSVADQRRKYGESVLRRADDQLRNQREHEGKVQARMEEARQRRQEERERQEAAEREQAERKEREAEQLRKQRAEARKEAQELILKMKAESDEERSQKQLKAERRRAREELASAAVSGDDEAAAATAKDSKKKRPRKIKKSNGEGEGGGAPEEADEALFSGGDDGPAKKRPKKRGGVIKESDDEDAPVPASATASGLTSRSKKQFKSKEIVEDSDEDMD